MNNMVALLIAGRPTSGSAAAAIELAVAASEKLLAISSSYFCYVNHKAIYAGITGFLFRHPV
jgi:hypothetical protein